MKLLSLFLSLVVLALPYSVSAEQQPAESLTPSTSNNTAYISDELFIYFHSGPGTQYRILGTIDAGEQVTLMGAPKNGYQQLVDERQREGWVDAKYLSKSPGLKVVVAELNAELADHVSSKNSLEQKLTQANQQVAELDSQLSQLQEQHKVLNEQYQVAANELDNKELNIMLTWFMYGGGVMAIGVLLGLILPRFFKRRNNYSSWG
ncbi:TIGR04211 family SH3 domain-containing protein [Thalassotalea ponticola]|uniref:TIGR04211 family SH3 domain-containing protein n=1 Tax=Thalassotalea ponticola TaxID=1523392 RepID=UPI0025B584B9|nr:TIGR04211 family SH3 domain-containing protein [Thalassotalea ponticola]MDN3651952.1 TIGR04211 family SH3 domain-containing protein [Thalassotalea ponticola]